MGIEKSLIGAVKSDQYYIDKGSMIESRGTNRNPLIRSHIATVAGITSFKSPYRRMFILSSTTLALESRLTMRTVLTWFMCAIPLSKCLYATSSTDLATTGFSVLAGVSKNFSSSSNAITGEDPRFSCNILYGEIDLPVTPIFMNVVELLAQYAEMDYLGRTIQRHGIVLPEFPQVEIAVLPTAPAITVPVRLVVWAIYDSTVEMAETNSFKECEIAVRWNGRSVAHIYFTIPSDKIAGSFNQTKGLDRYPLLNRTELYETFNTTTGSYSANTGRFSWRPIYKPSAKNILPKDIFILVMAVLKNIAQNPGPQKVEGAFRIGSPFVDANAQFYLQDRLTPRRRPPFFQYAHVREAMRRLPAWMLQQRRFAEFYCSIVVSTIPVGQVLLDKGQFRPSSGELNSNASVF